MPYLGRITLLQVLGHPEIRAARTGADLVDLLDRLAAARRCPGAAPRAGSALARRTYAQAIAWWGARMAEALQHAHDRQVLHRDVKPSNVLVTGDGLPMLLDFNLRRSRGSTTPDAAPAALGGTLAYMAPEHLEALAGGGSNCVDARSDLYALGVVLFDCLVRGIAAVRAALEVADDDRVPCSRRPSGGAGAAPAARHASRRAAGPRGGGRAAAWPPTRTIAMPRRRSWPPTSRRWPTTAPLRFAREPMPSRCVRWLRRNRRRLGVAAPFVLALGGFGVALVGAQMAALRREAEVRNSIATRAGMRSKAGSSTSP